MGSFQWEQHSTTLQQTLGKGGKIALSIYLETTVKADTHVHTCQ